jgi:hypothetical protein
MDNTNLKKKAFKVQKSKYFCVNGKNKLKKFFKNRLQKQRKLIYIEIIVKEFSK